MCARERESESVCVYVCVCVRASAFVREGEKGKKREKKERGMPRVSELGRLAFRGDIGLQAPISAHSLGRALCCVLHACPSCMLGTLPCLVLSHACRGGCTGEKMDHKQSRTGSSRPQTSAVAAESALGSAVTAAVPAVGGAGGAGGGDVLVRWMLSVALESPSRAAF